MSDKKLVQTKLDALILHFSKKTPLHLGYKKLAKLMYFTDFTAYELNHNSITNELYKKYTYGPMPVRFYNILKDLKRRKLINYNNQAAKYVPASIKALTEPDYSVFSKKEYEIIEMIADKFHNSTASELEQIAKSEPPYKMVEYNEEIPYHLAFYRNSFGEMEINDDADSSRYNTA